jgi:hypothetical protein
MRLPEYGRDLVSLQRSGRNVQWLVIAIGFRYGRAVPRLVVADDVPIAYLDLTMVRGIECMVVHDACEQRALDVAELALRNGARKAGVFDMGRGSMTFTTDEVRAVRGIARAFNSKDAHVARIEARGEVQTVGAVSAAMQAKETRPAADFGIGGAA